jgi:hypothetical protein
MNRLRGWGSALWLVLALVVGQHVAVLHDLGHAVEKVGQKDPANPPKPGCGEHFACSQLASGIGHGAVVLPFVASGIAADFAPADRGRRDPARLAYRSRAPPRYSA